MAGVEGGRCLNISTEPCSPPYWIQQLAAFSFNK
jgi:hypothetical protein